MTRNVGNIDRIIRIALAIVLAYLDWSGKVTGALSWVVGIVAIIMAVTALINFCPLYKIFGINTCKVN